MLVNALWVAIVVALIGIVYWLYLKLIVLFERLS